MRITKEMKKKYYTSREWGLKRGAINRRCNGRCERCFYGLHEETHHLTYERFGNEELTDLEGLCVKCHEFRHGRSNDDPILEIDKIWDAINLVIARRDKARESSLKLDMEVEQYYFNIENRIAHELISRVFREWPQIDDRVTTSLHFMGYEVKETDIPAEVCIHYAGHQPDVGIWSFREKVYSSPDYIRQLNLEIEMHRQAIQELQQRAESHILFLENLKINPSLRMLKGDRKDSHVSDDRHADMGRPEDSPA